MVNKNLFKTSPGQYIPRTDAVNEAGGSAYKMSDSLSLAQFACTGCFNATYYVSAKDQLETVKKLLPNVDPELIAKVAVYAHEKSFMKDMPAFLAAHLAVRSPELLKKVFHRIVTNGKMLRNFAQMLRSGELGRKSFGSVSKKLMQEWFRNKSSYNIFVNSIGNDPSLADVMRMVHPKPENLEKAALFAYLMGAEKHDGKLVVFGKNHKTKEQGVFYQHEWEALPEIVKLYENYKANGGDIPKGVPFEFLDSLGLGKEEWIEVAKSMTWQQIRQNLNTLQRHGVFEDSELIDLIASKLRNPELIAKAKVFPYQLLMAYKMTEGVPHAIQEALQDAMEIAISNVPPLGTVYVAVDTSGSMGSPITGNRGGKVVSSKATCIDVAALYASSILRTNKTAEVIPFAEAVKDIRLNPRDSVMTNAKILASLYGGGTNCSSALWKLNHEKKKGDAVIYVSDYESWVDSRTGFWGNSVSPGTATMQQWNIFKQRNPKAKLICIDLTPNTMAQVVERPDILQVGGFSDQVFNVVSSFLEGGNNKDYWLSVIKSVEI
jgi:60 kDa SS-A/Ro ribonucleoprotein